MTASEVSYEGSKNDPCLFSSVVYRTCLESLKLNSTLGVWEDVISFPASSIWVLHVEQRQGLALDLRFALREKSDANLNKKTST